MQTFKMVLFVVPTSLDHYVLIPVNQGCPCMKRWVLTGLFSLQGLSFYHL